MRTSTSILLGIGIFASTVSGQSIELQAGEIPAGEFTYQSHRGQMTVPQLYDEPDQGSLRLAVMVLRSTSEDPGPPVFFLNGIPGAATAMRDSEMWAAYLEESDVVLFDQRGAGRSEPRLQWDQPDYRAELLFGSPEVAQAHAIETAEAVRSYTEDNGVHLRAFNTRESARDIESVRKALGYDQIRILGHSAGTHLGFAYLRKFGERVAHFASIGTAGPNDIHSMPQQIDGSLRRISELAAADPRIGESMPNLYERVENILDEVAEKPIEFELVHPETGARVELLLGRQGLRFILMLDLGDPRDFIIFPRMIHELENGSTDTLAWFVDKRYQQMAAWPALLFINRGASGATPERWAEIRRQAESSPFGLARCNFSPEIDAAFGIEDLGDDFRAAVHSDVKTLFVSGTLDANTPPERAEAAMRGFPNAQHLIVENAGHDGIFNHPEVHATIRAFFADQPVDEVKITSPIPQFCLLEGRDLLVSHPALPQR